MHKALVGLLVASLAPLSTNAQQPAAADAQAAVARARAALEIPRIVDSVRKRGVPEGDIASVMGDVMRRGVPANETRDVLAAADASIKAYGPVDNFGAFVQGRLAAGLRGRALSQAIRDEHARRGKTKSADRTKTRAAEARGQVGPDTRAKTARDAAAEAKTKAAENPAAAKESPAAAASAAKRRIDSLKTKAKRP